MNRSLDCRLWAMAALLGCTMLTAAPAAAGGGYEVPQVMGPIPGASSANHMLDAAAYQLVPLDLARYGYVEREYFVRGTANVYDFNADAALTNKITVIGQGPYVNRIFVRQPAEKRRFSGHVMVEILNATPDFDNPIMWSLAYRGILEHGDAYVGITSRPIDVAALKTFNPQRYAPLGWPNPVAQNSQNCPVLYSSGVVGGASYATQDGFLWDIVSQTAALLRSPSRQNPLSGYDVRDLYLAGYSQGAYMETTYINSIVPNMGGVKPFDGYFVASGFGQQTPINQCTAAPSAPHDPRDILHSPDAPIIATQTLSDYAIARAYGYRPDGDAPTDRFRYYEEAGPSHVTVDLIDGLPSVAEAHRAGQVTIGETYQTCNPLGLAMNGFPEHQLMDATWELLKGWATYRLVPPHAPLLTGGVDANGNATGGIRSPNIDVPTATFTLGNAGTGASGLCFLFGSQVPIPSAKLKAMYGTHAGYVNAFRYDAGVVQAQEFLTPQDAYEAILAAQASSVP